jgi:hypothetical protein
MDLELHLDLHLDLDLELHQGTRSRDGPELFPIFWLVYGSLYMYLWFLMKIFEELFSLYEFGGCLYGSAALFMDLFQMNHCYI